MSITLNAEPSLSFVGPDYLDLTRPPAGGGLYAILDPVPGELDNYRVLYIGKTVNFRERGFPRSHEHYTSWAREAGSGRAPYLRIAYLPMRNEGQMIELERYLIGQVAPPCNYHHRPLFRNMVAAALSEQRVSRAMPVSGLTPIPPGNGLPDLPPLPIRRAMPVRGLAPIRPEGGLRPLRSDAIRRALRGERP